VKLYYVIQLCIFQIYSHLFRSTLSTFVAYLVVTVFTYLLNILGVSLFKIPRRLFAFESKMILCRIFSSSISRLFCLSVPMISKALFFNFCFIHFNALISVLLFPFLLVFIKDTYKTWKQGPTPKEPHTTRSMFCLKSHWQRMVKQ